MSLVVKQAKWVVWRVKIRDQKTTKGGNLLPPSLPPPSILPLSLIIKSDTWMNKSKEDEQQVSNLEYKSGT